MNRGFIYLFVSQYFSRICFGVRESRHLLIPDLKISDELGCSLNPRKPHWFLLILYLELNFTNEQNATNFYASYACACACRSNVCLRDGISHKSRVAHTIQNFVKRVLYSSLIFYFVKNRTPSDITLYWEPSFEKRKKKIFFSVLMPRRDFYLCYCDSRELHHGQRKGEIHIFGAVWKFLEHLRTWIQSAAIRERPYTFPDKVCDGRMEQ